MPTFKCESIDELCEFLKKQEKKLKEKLGIEKITIYMTNDVDGTIYAPSKKTPLFRIPFAFSGDIYNKPDIGNMMSGKVLRFAVLVKE